MTKAAPASSATRLHRPRPAHKVEHGRVAQLCAIGANDLIDRGNNDLISCSVLLASAAEASSPPLSWGNAIRPGSEIIATLG